LLLFFITSMIRENMFDLLCLIPMLSNATGVVGWLVIVGAFDGVSTRLMKL